MIHPKSMIVSTGSAIPEKVLTNHDLEKMVDTSDEWIRTRTGIEKRHIAAENELTSDLATAAAKKAMQEANVSPEELDYIILATITPDVGFPSTACFVQMNLGAVNATAMDISAACTGFIYALELADTLITVNKAKTVLVIGAETLSKVTDYTDRATCVLFGDGAGAAILKPAENSRGVLGTFTKSNGNLHYLLHIPGLGTKHLPTHETLDQHLHYIRMAGREVFKYAVTAMGEAAVKIIQDTGLNNDEIDLLISHQANLRIIDATAKRLNIPSERVFVNVNNYGNTSAASIPIALDEAMRTGKIHQGNTVVLVAFGAGFTWGSAAIKL